MEDRVAQFFSESTEEGPRGHFHRSLQLYSQQEMSWEQTVDLSPHLPKGWYELLALSPADRIEFVSGFWNSKLDFSPHLPEALDSFFSSLQDIKLFLAQKSPQTNYEAYLVYHLKNDAGFFWGHPPASEDEILRLRQLFEGVMLPHDYLSFLTIHNGFSKPVDCGVIATCCFEAILKEFQQLLATREHPPIETKGDSIAPQSLIPFYLSHDREEYQCFFRDWYPTGEEMGNVCYSVLAHTISECKRAREEGVSLSFPTFSHWLIFYMECLVT